MLPGLLGPLLEAEVSKVLWGRELLTHYGLFIDEPTHHGQMPFLWINVPDAPSPKSDRAYLELNSIALLSNFERMSIDPRSLNWLGLQSSKRTIQESGLWNTNHVEKSHDPAFLEKFRAYVGRTVA